MAYRFVQGIDYGPRDGTLGLSFHMAEGGDGTLGFLRQHPGETHAEWIQRVRGVSCNGLLLQTGEMVQMLPWDHASGNNNPNDRAGEYGYYGHQSLVDVLGDHWPDPNTWQISVEICGWRGGGAPVPVGETAGPNAAQVATAIKWGLEMRALFPSLRGANGHHDQSPKACPGLTPNMKAIFAGIGGHGLWTPEDPTVDRSFTIPAGAVDGTFTVTGDGHGYLRLLTGQVLPIAAATAMHGFGPVKLVGGGITGPDDPRDTGYVVGIPTANEAGFMLTADGAFVATAPPAVDCKPAVDTAVAAERARATAIATAAAADIKGGVS